MKYLLLLLIIVVVLLLTRRGGAARRAPAAEPKSPAPAAPAQAQAMVACAHCGVHLPRDEALAGPNGYFCGEAHRRLHQTPGEDEA